jgi:hypothetical protein
MALVLKCARFALPSGWGGGSERWRRLSRARLRGIASITGWRLQGSQLRWGCAATGRPCPVALLRLLLVWFATTLVFFFVRAQLRPQLLNIALGQLPAIAGHQSTLQQAHDCFRNRTATEQGGGRLQRRTNKHSRALL